MYTSKEIIIFGNGLGRALDNEYFSLETAIQAYWDLDNSDLVDKTLIKDCLPIGKEIPTSEDDLDKVHLASICCNILSKFPSPDLWLKDKARLFPQKIQYFIYFVSRYFHFSSKALPQHFILTLINHIKETKNHVATLNYDPLIYTPFCDENILTEYSRTYLVDGMQKIRGFHGDNLIPRGKNDFGLYLHLHGSPRFIEDNNGYIFKCDAANFYNGEIDGIRGKHIVLTHIKHKKSIISSSELLSTYWSFLELILGKVDRVTLFGYSGCDEHLNKLIQTHADSKIRVVEWKENGSKSNRMKYWKKKIGRNSLELILEDDILKFNRW